MNLVKKEPYSDRIFTLFVFFLPFLYQYKGIAPQLSLGETLLAPFLLMFLAKELFVHKSKTDGYLLLFYFVSCFTTLLNSAYVYFVPADASTVFIRLVFYGILIYVCRTHICLDYGKKIYIAAVFLFSVYLIIQYVYNLATKDYLPICLNSNWQFPPEARPKLNEYYKFTFRASSLFLEPSYFALFSLPSVAILVFDDVKKTLKKYAATLVICVAIILSQATSGVAGLGVIVIVYVFGRNDTYKKRGTWIRALTIIVVVLISFLYMRYANDSVLVERASTGGSFDLRITRGFITYDALSWIHKIFGVGLNELEPYAKYYYIRTPYDENNLNYCCSMLQTLNISGVVGFVSLLAYLIHFKKGLNGQTAPALFWILVFIMCYESIMFTYRFAFYIVLIEAFARKYSLETEKKYSTMTSAAQKFS